MGIKTPRTVAAVGREHIVDAARAFDGPFITKYSRAGKGLGVRLFRSLDALQAYVEGPAFEPSVDGITLIQEYIEAPEPFITRVEFVGQEFLYAVKVDTSQGFELCPADACRIEATFCAADGNAGLFRIIKGFDRPIVESYRRFLEANGIHIAGIEFILDGRGMLYTYDVNTNTNYNPEAEAEAGLYGMRTIAAYLGRQLREVTDTAVGRRRAAG